MKINPSTIRRIISHENCPDGLASAILAKLAAPEAVVEFCQYNTPQHRGLVPSSDTVFVDFSPHRGINAEAWAATPNVWVLDHHEHAKDIVELFGDRGIYGGVLRSGAWLVWQYLLNCAEGSAANFAVLASIRDTWLTSDPEWPAACALAKLLMAVDRDIWLRSPHHAIKACEESEWIGFALAETEKIKAQRVLDHEVLRKSHGGYEVGMFTGQGELSSMVGELGRAAGLDVTVCCLMVYDREKGHKLVYSMRSGERVDVGAMAKFYGGGGHARAAGFTVDLVTNPYDRWVTLFGGWLEVRSGK
jgi:uncharacterized protein